MIKRIGGGEKYLFLDNIYIYVFPEFKVNLSYVEF
jgi:hypothetical protein